MWGDMEYRWYGLETMLSHALVNQMAGATYFKERRGIMQQWVEADAEAIPLRA